MFSNTGARAVLPGAPAGWPPHPRGRVRGPRLPRPHPTGHQLRPPAAARGGGLRQGWL